MNPFRSQMRVRSKLGLMVMTVVATTDHQVLCEWEQEGTTHSKWFHWLDVEDA